MPSYIGFSTQNANKPKSTNLPAAPQGGVGSTIAGVITGNKFSLADTPLVVRDFINALNIPQGQKVGQPSYGTTLWSFVFEPNTFDVQNKLETEIRRVANQDPRMMVNTVSAYPQENGILLEVELAVAPFNNAEMLSVFFNNQTNTAVIQ